MKLPVDGREFAFRPCEVTSSEAVAELAAEVEKLGGLDILCDEAGVSLGKPLVETAARPPNLTADDARRKEPRRPRASLIHASTRR